MGTYHYTNGDIYKGDWIQNKRTGKGTLKMQNEKYEGEFFENKLQ